MKIGIVGIDSFHVPKFAKILADKGHEVIIFEEITSKMQMSIDRRHVIKKNLKSYDIVEDLEHLSVCDAFMILNVDGNLHYDFARRIAKFHKPIFIDKPLCFNRFDAQKISELSKDVPILSCSVLRHSKIVQKAKSKNPKKIIIKGPLTFEREFPLFYWYGIHLVEIVNEIKRGRFESIALSESMNTIKLVTRIEDVIVEIDAEKGYDSKYSISINDAPFLDLEPLDDIYGYFIDQLCEYFMYKQSLTPLKATLEVLSNLDSMEKSYTDLN